MGVGIEISTAQGIERGLQPNANLLNVALKTTLGLEIGLLMGMYMGIPLNILTMMDWN